MMDYAYQNPKHREVVALTRKLNWYKEEMFARFVPYKYTGSWDGNTFPLFSSQMDTFPSQSVPPNRV
jgi:hypothetical protein